MVAIAQLACCTSITANLNFLGELEVATQTRAPAQCHV